jgi:hypothetical protein
MPPIQKTNPRLSQAQADAQYPVGKGYDATKDSNSPKFQGQGHVGGGVVSAKPNPKAKPGSGGRFAAFVDAQVAKGKTPDQARGIAAAAGRAKYGSAQMAKWSAKGRK